jgi:hypothetical protein
MYDAFTRNAPNFLVGWNGQRVFGILEDEGIFSKVHYKTEKVRSVACYVKSS